MSKPGSPSRSGRNWLTVSVLLVIAISVLALVVSLVPRFRRQVVTVDQVHQWSESESPPAREIVWQPAVQLVIEDEQPATHSHIRPQLADAGDVLYFTIRTAENDLDVVRSRRTATGWSSPQVVDKLNSPAADIGPVISSDGETLYLYSDRAGGLGGMDLYVAQRDGSGWTEPQNLGPAVNTSAHEYDPAITPDGRRLFFASNRDHQDSQAGPQQWTTTLRSDPGRQSFDLFVSDLDPATGQWKSSAPLADLNTPQHNEGSPSISSDGAFLFFSSDRPTPRGEKTNFDLYRARLSGSFLQAENLGAGINTPANEMEPAISLNGFRLHFSRSDSELGTHYALYESTAKEVYRASHWDDSSFWSFVAGLVNGVKQIFNHLWLILLVLAALASLWWLVRQIRFRHVAVPGFLMLALMLHLLLVTGSFFVFFQQSIAKRLRQLLEQEVVATQVLNSTVAKTPEQTALETIADLPMLDPISPTAVSRQPTEYAQPQPIELASPHAIKKGSALSSDIPRAPIIASMPLPNEIPEQQELLPRAAARPVRTSEQIDLMRTVAVELPQAESVEREPVDVQRETLPQPDEPVEPVSLSPAPTEVALAQPDRSPLLRSQRLAPSVDVIPAKVALPRDSSDDRLDGNDVDTPPAAERVAAVEANKVSPPSLNVAELPRTEALLMPTIAQPEPLKLHRDTQNEASPPGLDPLIPRIANLDAAKMTAAESKAAPLKRAARSGQTADIEADVSTESIQLSAAENSSLASPAGETRIDLTRQTSKPEQIEIEPLTVNPRDQVSMDALSEGRAMTRRPFLARRQDTQDSVADGLLARRTPSSSPLYADASVRLQNLLMRRQLDEATKLEVIKEFGGNDATLAAIRRGLTWIQQHQHRDGHWSLNEFHKNCADHKPCDGRGSSRSDTAGTGLALLPFLGDGNTHQDGPYREVVAQGITWLVNNQKPDGNLFTGGEGNAFMYSHGIATIALCECFGMTNDASLRDPAQRAIDFIVAAQDPKSGGWRYRPRDTADTSVVGWQVMALKSGQMAGLNVPGKTLQDAQRWLDTVAGQKDRAGQFSYQHNNNFNPAMTAEAILCLEYLDNQRESDSLTNGTAYLLKNLPQRNRETSYYWYYGTQAMFHLQGDSWRRWNESIHPLLVDSQRKEGPMVGTWNPNDQWERSGGRIYATSLRILMLEVYYRHLPLYQVVD